MNYLSIKKKALKDIAGYMCIRARTAPKAKGRDNLVIAIADEKQKKKIISEMKKLGKKESRPGCIRDAENLKKSDIVVLIGTKSSPLGLNCGFCGYPTCKELTATKGVCSYNSMDLGIALGSAVSGASDFHADNRMMYSAGRAAINSNVLKDCVMAIGIPLSAAGKNPFFDR